MISSQAPREDISSERQHFDRYYREIRTRPPDRNSAIWLEKAKNPSRRPLDYLEYAFYLIGDLKGKAVLDLGCGSGWVSESLASKGASVSAIDISVEGCVSTRLKLKELGSTWGCLAVMDAHSIGFRDEVFDVVVAKGVLHHLNIAKVAPEIHRVLKPGGRLVCCEPLRYGPLMRALKGVWLKLNGIKGVEETEHEEALRQNDFIPLEQLFRNGFIRPFNFVAKTARLRKRFGPLAISLRWIDYFLLSAVPFFRRYCTSAVCYFEK